MKNKYVLMAIPMYLFVLLFVLMPLIYVVALSFMTNQGSFSALPQFTLENYAKILEPSYRNTFVVSLRIGFISTVITMLVGYPFGYLMSRLSSRARSIIMLLIVIPFWTNALIRIYGWITILRSSGLLSSALLNLGIIQEQLSILYTEPAVVIGMVYALIPFMILSVYSSCSKLDPSLIEAAKDLGASPIKAFWTITFKLSLPGLLSGFVLVFVPSIGLFFISDLMGGGKIMIVGTLIKNQLMTSRNWPFGAALSVVMLLMMFIIIGLYRKITKVKDIEGLV